MAGPLPLGDPAPANGALPTGLTSTPATPFSVYLHVPFCRVRCGYCDFNTYTAAEVRGAKQEEYAAEVAREIQLAHRVLAEAQLVRSANTVFIGGGTPTLLPPGDLAAMLDGIRKTTGIAADAEVTVEANPDTVTPSVARQLADAGVTRLSIGMQSAVPSVLAALDRTHDPARVGEAVDAARAAGLNVSVDLIYGAPGETLDEWGASVEAAIAYEPDHISAYALIIEDGTKLARQIERGEVERPDDDLQADMYELADDGFAAAGFDWYEISNFAKGDEQRSKHNSAYWSGADWWGFGPGAHSHVGGLRWWNVKHPAAYAQRLHLGTSPAAGRERPDEASRRLEEIMLATRMRVGMSIESLDAHGRRAVAGLMADELIDARAALAGRIVLTRRGRLLADAVVRRLTDSAA